jgi:hypothetical protein
MNNIKHETLLSLVADLIQELIDLGYNDKDLVWILTQHGFSEKFIKANYNLPFDFDKDSNE